jgi:pimeloyl-ACP methyl ester carboxylesterase
MRSHSDSSHQDRDLIHGSLFVRFLCLALCLILASGCAAPIGAKRASSRATYAQMEQNALSSGEPSADTESLLHRHGLKGLFKNRPAEAVRQMHSTAVATGDRDLLFALSEMSFLTGEDARKSQKPWDSRDPRVFYRGAAVYAYLFLFSKQSAPPPSGYDRRFRAACDLYNYGLGLSLSRTAETNGIADLQSAKRLLPVGEINIELDLSEFPWSLENFQHFLTADLFVVRGFSVRNRTAGIGAPLIGVRAKELTAGIRTSASATALLRINGSLKDLETGACQGELELHSAFGPTSVQIDAQTVPLETDVSVQMAYAMNQSRVWSVSRKQFLSLREVIPTGIYPSQPVEPGRIPVVFVHGTFSSPVWWAEMLNTLRADPVLKQRYQFWYFIYNSSVPVLLSAARLRQSLEATVKEFDSNGTDPFLQQMVLVGHSQGGLLSKLAVTDTGDQLWNAVSTNSLESTRLSEAQKAEVRRIVFVKPLPFVKRVVFISTPHRGSYRAGGVIRDLARRIVSIPVSLTQRVIEFRAILRQLHLWEGVDIRRITSIDGMSTRSPILKTLAEIPIAPGVTAHSIIPVKGDGDFRTGDDGVVKYTSAHVAYVQSELVVRHKHSCQSNPAAIEEVRRILHLHLNSHEFPPDNQSPESSPFTAINQDGIR